MSQPLACQCTARCCSCKSMFQYIFQQVIMIVECFPIIIVLSEANQSIYNISMLSPWQTVVYLFLPTSSSYYILLHIFVYLYVSHSHCNCYKILSKIPAPSLYTKNGRSIAFFLLYADLVCRRSMAVYEALPDNEPFTMIQRLSNSNKGAYALVANFQ